MVYVLALFGNAASCDAHGPSVSTESGMRGDQRLAHRYWEPSGNFGLSPSKALFPLDILEKGEMGLVTFQVEINGLCSFIL